MNSNPLYAAALWPDSVRCCGVKLRQLRLGHALLLQRIRSPFAPGSGGLGGLGDLVAAVFVCSRAWRSAAAGLNRPWFSLWARWRAFRRWKRETEDAIAFRSYLEAAWRSPKSWLDRAGGRQRGTDLLQLLIVTQRARWRKTLPEALDTSVAEAILDHLEHLEFSGSLRIWNDQDHAMVEKLEEIMARSREESIHG